MNLVLHVFNLRGSRDKRVSGQLNTHCPRKEARDTSKFLKLKISPSEFIMATKY